MPTHAPLQELKLEPMTLIQGLENYIKSDIDEINSLSADIAKLAEAEVPQKEQSKKLKDAKSSLTAQKEEKMMKRERLEAGILEKLQLLTVYPSSIFPAEKLFEITNQVHDVLHIRIDPILDKLVHVADDRKMVGLSDLRSPQELADAAQKGPVTLKDAIRSADDLGQKFLRSIHRNPKYTKFRERIIGPIFRPIIQALLLDLARFAVFHKSSETKDSEKSADSSFPYSEYTRKIIFQVINDKYFEVLKTFSENIFLVPLPMLESGATFYDTLESMQNSFKDYDLAETVTVTFSPEELKQLKQLKQDDTIQKEEKVEVKNLFNNIGGLDKNLRDLGNAFMSFLGTYKANVKQNAALILPVLEDYFPLSGISYEQALKNELALLLSDKIPESVEKEEKGEEEKKEEKEKYARYGAYRKILNSKSFAKFKTNLEKIHHNKHPYEKIKDLLKKPFFGKLTNSIELSKFANQFNSFFTTEKMTADFPMLSGYVFLQLHHDRIYKEGYIDRLFHELTEVNLCLSQAVTDRCNEGVDGAYNKISQSKDKTRLFQEGSNPEEKSNKMEGESSENEIEKKENPSSKTKAKEAPTQKELLKRDLDNVVTNKFFKYIRILYAKLSVAFRFIPKATLSNSTIHCTKLGTFNSLQLPIVGSKENLLVFFNKAFKYLDQVYSQSIQSIPSPIPDKFDANKLADCLRSLVFYLDITHSTETFHLCHNVLTWLRDKKNNSDKDYEILSYVTVLALACDIKTNSADTSFPLTREIMLRITDRNKFDNAISIFQPQLLKIAKQFKHNTAYEFLFGKYQSEAEKLKDKVKPQLRDLDKGMGKTNEGIIILGDSKNIHALKAIIGEDLALNFLALGKEVIANYNERIHGSPSSVESSSESPVVSSSDFDRGKEEEKSDNSLDIREMKTTTPSAQESSEEEKDLPSQSPSAERKKEMEISKKSSEEELGLNPTRVTSAPASTLFSLPTFPAPPPPINTTIAPVPLTKGASPALKPSE